MYALWFADTGLSDGQISVLFIVGSAVGFVGEVPSGALADRFSRRSCLIAAGVIQAAGCTVWTVLPGFAGFATGFVLWGISGTLVSGAFEALLFDGLAEVGAQDHYQRILGAVSAITLAAQLPAAVAATMLFALGGYSLVGWVSVAVCVAAAALAVRLPEPARHSDDEEADLSYLAALRSGLTEVMANRTVGLSVVAVALLVGLDGLDEYFPLLAQDWQVATAVVPLAVLAIPVVGAIGAPAPGRAAGSARGPWRRLWPVRWRCWGRRLCSTSRSVWSGWRSSTASTSGFRSLSTPGCSKGSAGARGPPSPRWPVWVPSWPPSGSIWAGRSVVWD